MVIPKYFQGAIIFRNYFFMAKSHWVGALDGTVTYQIAKPKKQQQKTRSFMDDAPNVVCIVSPMHCHCFGIASHNLTDWDDSSMSSVWSYWNPCWPGLAGLGLAGWAGCSDWLGYLAWLGWPNFLAELRCVCCLSWAGQGWLNLQAGQSGCPGRLPDNVDTICTSRWWQYVLVLWVIPGRRFRHALDEIFLGETCWSKWLARCAVDVGRLVRRWEFAYLCWPM